MKFQIFKLEVLELHFLLKTFQNNTLYILIEPNKIIEVRNYYLLITKDR